jgi:hypothetical protein
LVEQLTLNQRVPGSSPGAPTIPGNTKAPQFGAFLLFLVKQDAPSARHFEGVYTRARTGVYTFAILGFFQRKLRSVYDVEKRRIA